MGHSVYIMINQKMCTSYKFLFLYRWN